MWDVDGLEEWLRVDFVVDFFIKMWLENDDKLYEEKLRECIYSEVV